MYPHLVSTLGHFFPGRLRVRALVHSQAAPAEEKARRSGLWMNGVGWGGVGLDWVGLE